MQDFLLIAIEPKKRISTIMTTGDAINELVVVQLFIIQMCTLLDGSTFASRKSSLRTFI